MPEYNIILVVDTKLMFIFVVVAFLSRMGALLVSQVIMVYRCLRYGIGQLLNRHARISYVGLQ